MLSAALTMSFTFPHRLNGLRLAEALAAQFEGCGSVKDALRCAAHKVVSLNTKKKRHAKRVFSFCQSASIRIFF